jgi:hypothetical protein
MEKMEGAAPFCRARAEAYFSEVLCSIDLTPSEQREAAAVRHWFAPWADRGASGDFKNGFYRSAPIARR